MDNAAWAHVGAVSDVRDPSPMNDAYKYILGEDVEEWRLTVACRKFSELVFRDARARTQKRNEKYFRRHRGRDE